MQKVGLIHAQFDESVTTVDAPDLQERPPEGTIHRRTLCGLDLKL